jgi:uncharacterized protein YjbI with pentapeptide repeats
MKTITETELKSILDQHKLWLAGKGGSRANLSHTNLRDANLSHTNLRDANLTGANLEDADLEGTNLRGADLKGANLTGTILEKNKAEKQPEVASVKSENLRFEIEAIAKKHGMKVDSIALSFL